MKEMKKARDEKNGLSEGTVPPVSTPNLAKIYGEKEEPEKKKTEGAKMIHNADPPPEPKLVKTTVNTESRIVDQTHKAEKMS